MIAAAARTVAGVASDDPPNFKIFIGRTVYFVNLGIGAFGYLGIDLVIDQINVEITKCPNAKFTDRVSVAA
jgi:hypothetical protein